MEWWWTDWLRAIPQWMNDEWIYDIYVYISNWEIDDWMDKIDGPMIVAIGYVIQQ
jgi:hypothetical protein